MLKYFTRRSGKHKLNRHLDHRRNTRVQLIRQRKSCNLSLPSAQVANELPGPSGTVPLAIPWIRPTPRYQCQSLRLSVRPSSRAVLASLWPMARIEILSAAAKQPLAYLPPSASCKHINMFIFIFQKKQTVDRTNPSGYFVWVTKPTLQYQLKPTEAVFSAPGVVIPGPLVPTGLVTEPNTAFRASPKKISSNPQVKSSA